MQFVKWLTRAPDGPRRWEWWQTTGAGLPAWLRSFGGVFLIFILSRLAFYVAAFVSTGMLPRAPAWPG